MKVAAFNAKNLGWKKVSTKAVVRLLVKIISRYSIVLILEVMDKSGKAMDKLKEELNKTRTNRARPYSVIASEHLGRHKYKEQFVCFYREDEATLIEFHQYDDNQPGDEDAFAREPLILRFCCPTTAVKDLVLIPVHTKPEDSEKELDELHDVVQGVRENWETDDIMILGDFNADGRYLSKKKKQKIRICSSPYHWLIDDDVDTTSSNYNDNTYDRIVVYGRTMLDAVVPGSAKSFNFQEEFNLSDEQALSVSDHYPVEVELKASQKSPRRRTRTKGPQKKNMTKKTTGKRKVGAAAETAAKRRRSNK